MDTIPNSQPGTRGGAIGGTAPSGQKDLLTKTDHQIDRRERDDRPHQASEQGDLGLRTLFEEQVRTHLFSPLHKNFDSSNVQHIRDIKRNKFRPENIMKLQFRLALGKHIVESFPYSVADPLAT